MVINKNIQNMNIKHVINYIPFDSYRVSKRRISAIQMIKLKNYIIKSQNDSPLVKMFV